MNERVDLEAIERVFSDHGAWLPMQDQVLDAIAELRRLRAMEQRVAEAPAVMVNPRAMGFSACDVTYGVDESWAGKRVRLLVEQQGEGA